jgi:hypothetical protein
MSTVTITQNIEIVTVLCSGVAVAFNGILSRLQSLYPSSGWTDSLLLTRLNAGKKSGLFTAVGSDPGGAVEGYALNKRMLSLNWAMNSIYGPFCTQIIAQGCAPSCGGSGSATGTGAASGSSS